MKAKTSKTILLGLIGISVILLASLGAVVHAAPRAPDTYKINEILFPDPIFRQYILDTIDKDKDGYLDAIERGQVTQINLNNGYNGSKISDLTGIEFFPDLTYLDCSENQLTSLDLRNNLKLEELFCFSNVLTTLNVAQNNSIIALFCYNNQLTELDISNMQILDVLDCSYNKITTIHFDPLSDYHNFHVLNCSNNELTSLDFIQDASFLFELSCSNNHLLSLDMAHIDHISPLTASGQTRTLSVPLDGYDLSLLAPNINGNKISNVTGAVFNGTFMENYIQGNKVTYDYDIGNGETMDVTLTLEIETVISNINYKDGGNSFTSWKAGYTAPSTYEEGTGVALPTADNVEKEGYIFAGWYDNENFTGNPITEIDAAATGDKILYAKWVPETFSVTIPKRITLSGETKSGAYSIGCTGNIKDTRYISVVPDSTFMMTQKGKDNVTGTMVQQITKFRADNYTGSLEADETKIGTNIRGTIHTPDLTAGSWNGALNFKITLS